MNELYAKSGPEGPSLVAHCRDVRAAADAIWAAVGDDLAALIPGLSSDLPRLLAAAALLHDLLKANSSFQDMVRQPPGRAARQPVRHEVLAAVLFGGDGPLAVWLRQLLPNDSDRWAVVWAVAGHHFKMIDPARKPLAQLYRDVGAASTVEVQLGHPQVRELLAEVASLFVPSVTPPVLTNHVFDTADDDAESLRERVQRYPHLSAPAWRRLKSDPANRTKIAVLKALLAAADAAGSALPENGRSPTDWTRTALGGRVSVADLDRVLAKDAAKGFRDFQHQVGASDKPVTIVTAGCGNGKTTAAYLWAKRWAVGKKLFFTYPTTGTSTAGYQSYLADHQGLPADLIHGKSEVDLEDLRQPKAEAGEEREQRADHEARIDSLRAWDRHMVVCTVDTVLGLLQNQRRGVYSFPAFATGAFVFDELHAYDDRLFGGLLRFLETFPGVPALLMSASIPHRRLEALKAVLGDRASEKPIRGDEDIEDRKRYRLEPREMEACWADVSAALTTGRKVLWVCNTVRAAIETAREARAQNLTPIVYHSRFRYEDRKKRQDDLMGRFKGDGPVLAITTQVCEMSLDISADLLVTAECPLPALVQRLGRLNRYAETHDPWPCLVYPFAGLPYNEEPAKVELYGDYRASMAAARDAVKTLAGQPCSQRMLADRLAEMDEADRPEKYSAWLDDGWVTEPMPVRDGDQSVTVILTRDLDAIAAKHGPNRMRWSAGKLARWTLPMNFDRRVKLDSDNRAWPYAVASNEQIDYSEAEGAEWRTS